MALMPGLQINIGQQLKLTPQLQQSIKILQYSALEVQQTISTTLETNFMLELDEDRPEDAEEFASEEEAAEVADASENEIDIEASDTLSDDLQIDCEWEEVYTDISPVSSSIKSDNDDYTSPENYTSSEVTLSEKLYWQSDIYSWTETQELIASYIIDDINDEAT